MTESNQVRIGMMHGRFQPFHVGHLEYLQAARNRVSELLIVGITNPTRTEIGHPTDDHRHTAEANPFSFAERALMILKSVDSSLNPQILVVPFEIQSPNSWGFLPAEAVQFVNPLEEWDLQKASSFRTYGFEVEITTGVRRTSGSEIRARLREGLPITHLVPSGTLEVLSNLVT